MRMFSVICPVTKHPLFTLDSCSVQKMYELCYILRTTFQSGKEGYRVIEGVTVDFSYHNRRCSVYLREGYVIIPD